MASLGSTGRLLWRAVFNSAHVPAAIALIVVLVAGIYAGNLNRIVYQQQMRAEVLAKVNLVRAKLEGNITSNIQLVRGLVATITTEPYMSQMRFAELAKNIVDEKAQLRNIAGAPGLVVSLMYPLEGNERAIGLNYMQDEQQRPGVMKARDTRQPVLAGPINLKQGGQGFIGRFPVYFHHPRGGSEFWGIISAVVDVDRLYADSGVTDPDLGIDIALTGRDSMGRDGAQFYGKPEVLANDPVTADVILPSGTWQIAATPAGGWDITPPNAWLVRLMIGLAALLVAAPILIAGRLVGERGRHYSELQQRERKLTGLSQRLELALNASQIGVWEHNLDTDELFWDARVNELYGAPQDGGPRSARDWMEVIHPDDAVAARRDFETAAANCAPYSSEFRLLLPDGTVRHMRTMATFHRDEMGSARLVGAEWDVTADVTLRQDLERARFVAELKNAELEAARERIEHNSLHDSLTGLPNRRYLDQLLERPAAGGTALLHIDLDRFKQINDTLGHAAGDAMLVHASKVLRSNVRECDFVARIGGDEFVVFCASGGDEAELAGLADRIICEMRQPVPYHGHLCRFGVSIGIAIETGEGADPKRLLVNADIALYRAKSRGRNRHEFFTEALQAEIVNTKRIADEILGGLERSEFTAYYQPQFDARTLEVAGVEALARWAHPTRGVLAPLAFLKTAEELNVVSTIDRLVLEQSLKDFRVWGQAGLNVPRISVNVSARRLQDGELIAALKELDITPGTVSFELVESIFLDENDDLIIWNVNQVKQLGIEVEIDDFGTGYASIVSLQKLKPRRLKIDRQLVKPIVRSPKQRRLLESIIEIGKSLDIEVVAEGVETMQHAHILKDIGADILQGYAFARPMKSDDLMAFIRARSWRQAS